MNLGGLFRAIRTMRPAVVGALAAAAMLSMPVTAAADTGVAARVLHITNHSVWTLQVLAPGTGCEVLTFTKPSHTFVADLGGDSGTYKGGSATVKVTWTAGTDTGLIFTGKWNGVQYAGTLAAGGQTGTGTLTKGAAGGC
jgi:hypothetical protein